MADITPQEWFNLSDDKRALISSKWNVYKGEGLEIIKAVYGRFEHEFQDNRDIKNINFGVYHGGNWVIGVTVKWSGKDKIRLPDTYYGFVIQTLYDEAPIDEMRKRAKYQFEIWFKEIKEKYNAEIKNQKEFKDMPEEKFYEMAWLMDGMSKYYNPFKDKGATNK